MGDVLKARMQQQAQVKQEPGAPEKPAPEPKQGAQGGQGVAGAEEEFKMPAPIDQTQRGQTDDGDVQELLSSLDEVLKMSIDSVLGFERFPNQNQGQQALPQVDENQWINGFSQSATPGPTGPYTGNNGF